MIQEFSFNASQYWKALRHRELILRLPLHRRFSNEDLLLDCKSRHFGWIQDEKIVSGLSLSLDMEQETIQIRQLWTIPAFRRKKIATFLLLGVLDIIEKAYKDYQIFLFARIEAKSLYEAANFKVIGDEFEHLGITHIRMERSLDKI
ncbi:MAG: GNAT family N-acetyltransferase [Chitinophagales bacterium]|jgi:predicted GNAT family N-acyltransferase|nr:GNAT family N-acetyltransferase [Chitinophagales bacterium]